MADSTSADDAALAERRERQLDVIVAPAIDRHWLKCFSCQAMLSDPQILEPCLHTICLACTNLAKRSRDKACPRCSKRIRIHRNNVEMDEIVRNERTVNEARADEHELDHNEFQIVAITASKGKGSSARYLVTWANEERQTEWLKKTDIDAQDLFKQFKRIRNKFEQRKSRAKAKQNNF